VSARTPPLKRAGTERLAAWLVTGPVGHFYSVVADVSVFGARLLARRVRGRS